MIHEFSFHIKKGDYIVLHNPIKYNYYSYPNNGVATIPENAVLRVERISIKTHSVHERYEVEFYFLVKKNKHIKTENKIPNKITIEIYDLNGVKYSLVKEEDIDTKVNALLRKHKIENLING
jgi:hypothetical protein